MLFNNDPFRDFDTVFRRVGTTGATHPMPMDAYRRGDDVWVHVDLPGVAADSLDINVERNVLTISAERDWVPTEADRLYMSERARGKFHRQVHLGEGLAAEHIEADLSDGVLTLRIPVAERAKPRKITINTSGAPAIEAESAPA
ncbi:MAG: Hsp20/alpha crystallin family protein [Acidimicrobiales bacterium]